MICLDVSHVFVEIPAGLHHVSPIGLASSALKTDELPACRICAGNESNYDSGAGPTHSLRSESNYTSSARLGIRRAEENKIARGAVCECSEAEVAFGSSVTPYLSRAWGNPLS